MKKREFLAVCVVVTLTGNLALAAEYPSKLYEVHEDANWDDIAQKFTGGLGVIPYGGDTVKIDDGVTLTMNFADGTSTSGSAGGLALSIDEMGYGFGHEDRDLNMSGGKFVAVGEGQDANGIGGGGLRILLLDRLKSPIQIWSLRILLMALQSKVLKLMLRIATRTLKISMVFTRIIRGSFLPNPKIFPLSTVKWAFTARDRGTFQ